MKSTSRMLWLLAAIGLCGTTTAESQDAFPVKPIKMIVGYAPGGPADVAARLVAAELNRTLGQPIVVENRPGAGAILAAELTAKAEPDGYTLGYFSVGAFATNPTYYKSLPYKVEQFAPVSTVIRSSLVFAVSEDVPAATPKELSDWIKAQPNGVNYGVAGLAGTAHLSGELFRGLTGDKMKVLNYRGEAVSAQELAGGQLKLYIGSIMNLLPFKEEKKVKLIASTAAGRLPYAPDVPTFKEMGMPELQVYWWHGIVAPRDTPKPIVDKLSKAIQAAVKSEVMSKRLATDLQPFPSTPEEMAALMKTDAERWAPIMERSGIKEQ